MAMIILGAAQCPICRQKITDASSVVTFSWFETDHPSLAMFSDAGVHFECLQSYPDHWELEKVFVNQLGEDGISPNGMRTQTLAPLLRVSFDSKQVLVVYGPLFVSLRIPRSTALHWADSDFWTGADHGIFSDRGLKAEYWNLSTCWEFSFWLCPFGFHLDQADPSIVSLVYRKVSSLSGKKALKDLQVALRFVRDKQ
jgi:hypothetical protein